MIGKGKNHASFPSLSFYLRLMGIYYRAWRLAVRGEYPEKPWRESSAKVRESLEGVGVRIWVEGQEVFDALEGPCVLVGNHMSTLETFVLPCLFPWDRPITFVVKESLLRIPVFGPILNARDPIAVTRRDARIDLKRVLDGGKERLAKGISVIVFPQTTRMLSFDPASFNSIASKLASRAGVPMVPVAIRSDAWAVGRPIKDFGPIRPHLPVHIRFGGLVDASDSRKGHEAVVAFISSTLAAWEKEGPPLGG